MFWSGHPDGHRIPFFVRKEWSRHWTSKTELSTVKDKNLYAFGFESLQFIKQVRTSRRPMPRRTSVQAAHWVSRDPTRGQHRYRKSPKGCTSSDDSETTPRPPGPSCSQTCLVHRSVTPATLGDYLTSGAGVYVGFDRNTPSTIDPSDPATHSHRLRPSGPGPDSSADVETRRACEPTRRPG